MKCPNCSFNNIASANVCKICGTNLEAAEGVNNDTLALDEALKGIFGGKIPSDNDYKTAEPPTEDPDTSSWEPIETTEALGAAETAAAADDVSEKSKIAGGGGTIGEAADKAVAEAGDTTRITEASKMRGTGKKTRADGSAGSTGAVEPTEMFESSEAFDKSESAEGTLPPAFNPLLGDPSEAESPREPNVPAKPEVIPVYERSEGGVSIAEEAENFEALPLDAAMDDEMPRDRKRKRSKTDEIAAVAMVILLICLGTLIYFAVQMTRTPKVMPPAPISTNPSVTRPTIVSSDLPTSTSSPSVSSTPSNPDEQSGSETETASATETTPKKTPFDESYFTKSGNLSGGTGKESDALRKVRMGDHYYFHRLVFDFGGKKTPTYYVSILEGGYLVQMRVENITDFTKDSSISEWSTVAKSVEISADTPNSIIINIYMHEPAMVHTYGIDDPGRIVLDLRGDSNQD